MPAGVGVEDGFSEVKNGKKMGADLDPEVVAKMFEEAGEYGIADLVRKMGGKEPPKRGFGARAKQTWNSGIKTKHIVLGMVAGGVIYAVVIGGKWVYKKFSTGEATLDASIHVGADQPLNHM